MVHNLEKPPVNKPVTFAKSAWCSPPPLVSPYYRKIKTIFQLTTAIYQRIVLLKHFKK